MAGPAGVPPGRPSPPGTTYGAMTNNPSANPACAEAALTIEPVRTLMAESMSPRQNVMTTPVSPPLSPGGRIGA
jgi:hypothetical protein